MQLVRNIGFTAITDKNVIRGSIDDM